MAGEVPASTACTEAFRRRHGEEWGRLRERLHAQLQQDIGRIFASSLYCDLELVFDSSSVQAHCCVLRARAAKFFSKLCSVAELRPLPNGCHCVRLVRVPEAHIKNFLRNLYTKCSVAEEELEVIKHLEQRGWTADSDPSPDSDAYLTPYSSPSEAWPDLSLDLRSYYSIVPIDEDVALDSGSASPVLERELAEQDALLRSFQTIRSREIRHTAKKPTSLPLLAGHCIRKQRQVCSSRAIKPRRAYLAVPDKDCLKTDLVSERSGEVNSENCVCVTEVTQNEDVTDVSVISIVDCCFKGAEDPLTFPLSPEMDGSAGGPDSGLDTCSTGFVPGGDFSSPRDYTVSETSGIDLTEAAAADEEMPHDEVDQPKSSSSSVSSEAITWDIYVSSMCSETKAFLEAERKFSYVCMTGVPQRLDEEWYELEDGLLSLSVPTDQVEHYCCQEHVGPECELQSASLPVDPSPSDSTSSSNTQSSSAKEEPQLPTTSSIAVSLSYPEAKTDWRITNGHNFFINAADLIDDSDTSLPYVTVSVPNEAKESTPVLDDSPLERSQCDIVDRGLSCYATVRSNFVDDDTPPVISADEFSEDFIPFLSSRPALDIKDMMNLSGHEALPISDNEVASPPVKQTQQASISRQSSNQDHTAEFQKEIRVVERLEPYVETRKITCKRKPGSVSTEDVSVSSLELANFDQSYGMLSDEDNGCQEKLESALSNVEKKVSHVTDEVSIHIRRHDSEEEIRKVDSKLGEPGLENTFSDWSDKKEESLCSIRSGGQTVNRAQREDACSTGETAVVVTKEEEAGKDAPVANDEIPRRASLIRRNTFELDPDDDRLALLRQDYERRQGNLLFQSCSPQFSGSEEVPDDSPSQLHSLPCLPADGKNSHSTPTPIKSPHVLPHVVGHEANTPDSLNNDGPIDNFFVPQTKASCIPEKTLPGKDDLDHVLNGRLENSGDNFLGRHGGYSRSSKPVVSGALTCSDVVLDEKQPGDSPKKQKRTESTPIVSGGVAASDFATAPQPKMDSPIFSRRKNELAPIVSGGAVCMPNPEVKERKDSMSMSTGSAWVVDMSDCSPNTARQSFDFKRRRRSEASHDLLNNPPGHDGQNSSLGFFVNLKDETPEDPLPTNSTSVVQKEQSKKPKEFFINVGECGRSPMARKKNITGERSVQKSKSQTDVPAKITIADDSCEQSDGTVSVKNTMFSMFIDFGSPSKPKEKSVASKDKTSQKKVATESVPDPEICSEDSNKSRSVKMNRVNNTTFDASNESPETQKSTYMYIDAGPTSTSVQMTTPAKSTVQDNIKTAVEEKKQSFFMFIETDSPVPRRKTLPSGLRPTFNRHSWNSDVPSEKRDDEASCAQARVHKRAHSLSVDRSAILEDGKPPLARSKMRRSSHSLHEDDSSASSSQGKLASRTQARLAKQTRSLESDDAARTGSEKCLRSKQLSGSSTEVEDSTHSPGVSQSTGPDEDCSISCTDPSNAKGNASSSATITESEDRGKPALAPKATERSEIEKQEPTSFVKLSDLDKEPKKLVVEELTPIATTNRMTRSIPETSWIESKIMMTRSIGGGGSSNVAPSSRSLSRLFPHLHTTGAPGQPHGKSPEPDEGDAQVSETSDLSSMQSSMGPSGLEGSTEETDASSSCAGRGTGPASRLGEDLLRMFLEEISPDVTVEVGGRRLRAHKCILSSRCQYFAAMLSGGWVESAGNVISLQGFSYNAVHFALCHIYSGTSNIPDTISIVELATLADMLGLEGLKEVIMYTLKVKYCHFFHKPCTMCAVGVVECLPLAAAYGLDDIYRKSLRWITRHFVRIWPTKGFASLPRELLDKCYQQHVVHMTPDNVLETIMNCDKLLATLPSVRWAEPVFTITSQLLEAAIKFLANNFCPVLNSDSFQALGKELSWNISRLEDSLMAAADRLPPDQACQSYNHLHKTVEADQHASQSFSELLRRLHKRVEASLVRQAARAARCPSWPLMDAELRRKVQEAAFLVLMPGEDGPRSKPSASTKRPAAQQRGTQRSSRSLDIRQVKLAMTQQARRVASGGRVSVLQADSRTRAQSAAPGHRKQKSEPPPVPKKTEEKPAVEPLVRPKTWPLRVMESKARPSRQGAGQPSASTPDKQGVARRQGKTLISSSDSSRTSSPAMRRAASSGARRKPGEGSAISVDSLTDEGSGRRTVSDGAMSKSLVSTRPDTPSVIRKKRDETTMSADSLSEKVLPTVSVSAPSRSSAHTRPDTPPTKGKSRQPLGRFASDGTISSDSLANTDSSPRGGVVEASSSPKSARPSAKTSGDLQQRSPSMRRVAMRQSANSPRDSPAFRRNVVTSGKQPAEIVASKPAPKSNKTAATLSPGVKRPAGKVTTRNAKTAPVSSPKLTSSRPASKAAPNRSTTKGPAPAIPKEGKKGCAVVNGDSKDVTQPPPTVGSRSGTFLKDEPTVIKLPAVKDSDE